MRSPSVERLMLSSSAARDLFPSLTLSAHEIRFDSTSRRRSSSEIDVASAGAARSAAAGADVPLDESNNTPAARQPERTVPQLQVWMIRSHEFSSSRTLPGQRYRENA